MESKQPQSSAQEQICKGCGWKGKSLRGHLRTKIQCRASNDMDVLKDTAKTHHREQMAAYNKRHREQINTRMKEHYKQHTTQKRTVSKERKETMAAYNEKHRSDINEKMANLYLETRRSGVKCPRCQEQFFSRKEMKRHIDDIHIGKEQQSFICQICDKSIKYNANLERHMKEVHGEVKHKCEQCPAAYTRKAELQKHMDTGQHFLKFQCSICEKQLVFKTVQGLVEHLEAKQTEVTKVRKGHTLKSYKSGITVTCKSSHRSIQVEEGEEVLGMPRKDKVLADQKRKKEKEKLINVGLSAANEGHETNYVKVEFTTKVHEENICKTHCKWCEEKIPFSDEFCTVRFGTNWQLLSGPESKR